MIKIPTISVLTIFGLLLVFTAPARSEMVYIGTPSSGEFSTFIDTNSITSNGRFVEASVTMKNNVPINRVSSSTGRTRVNCSYRSRNTIEYAEYDSKGKLLFSTRKPFGWQAIIPGSVGEAEYNFLCKI
jgi:hypothetical protein